MLRYRGEVWLPNIKCLFIYIKIHSKILSVYYTITMMKDPKENPLYAATEDVNDILVNDNPVPLTNSNQVTRLDSQYPFIRLLFNK